MKTVKFTTCNREKAEKSTRIRPLADESIAEMIQRAVRKLYGQTCWWWSDSGLGLYYGQVVHTSGNCITYRLRCDIE